MKKLAMLLALTVSLGGCTFLRDLWDRAEEYLPEPTPIPAETPIPEPTVEPPKPTVIPPPQVHWRDGYDVATYPVSGGSFQFWTRNIRQPTTTNRPGDYEYIIVRLGGEHISRLLVMSMYARNPRISLDWGGGHRFVDGRFSQPLPGPSHWRVASDRSSIWIELDGREIWRESGRAYWITSATMGGYARRGFLGEWRVE